MSDWRIWIAAAALAGGAVFAHAQLYPETLSQANCLWAAGEAPTERGASIKQQACRLWYPVR